MGKILIIKNADFSQVAVEHLPITFEKVDVNALGVYSSTVIATADLTWINGGITYAIRMIACTSYSHMRIDSKTQELSYIAFLKDNSQVLDSAVNFASGETEPHAVSLSGVTYRGKITPTSYEQKVPTDARYVAIYVKGNEVDVTPDLFVVWK